MACLETNEEIISGAILDLKLEPGVVVFEGNIILEKILTFLRFPIYIVTSNPSEIDPRLKLPEINPLFKIYPRTEIEYIEILRDIIKIQKTGIIELFGSNGKLDEHIRNIYWNYLSQIIQYWIDIDLEPELKEKAMLRYISNLLHSYLSFNPNLKEYEYFIPGEVYIPCMHDIYQTGDILSKGGMDFILLTPSCDLANTKAKNVTLAEIIHSDKGILNSLLSTIRQEPTKITDGELLEELAKRKSKAKGIIEDIMKNAYSSKYYFLPAYNGFATGIINFQNTHCIPFSSLNTYSKVFSISHSFIKDIVEKFSSYFSRQGSPDFNISILYDEFISKG
ncbi:MAG: hypothetical protein IPN68_14045 [Bacteroidetes bacterium]|nr:hypothetical protein [Bacteroidota bacterium]